VVIILDKNLFDRIFWGGKSTTPIQGFANKKINKIIP
jgi:hypothetical protein